nr:hypothetical protein [Marinicella sp. W31]MDC2878132.1 hypothetical protein [Marinicella sp. W31]
MTFAVVGFLMLPGSAAAFSGAFGQGVAAMPGGLGPVVHVASRYDNRPRLKAIRAKIVAGAPVSADELRLLANTGDGLAAYKLAERLAENPEPAYQADAAFYYGVAVATGRTYAVSHLVTILSDEKTEIAPAQLGNIERSLLLQAQAGNRAAVNALTRLYMQGRPFGFRPDMAEALLRSGAVSTKDAEMALQAALSVASHAPLNPDEVRALRQYLAIARESSGLGVRTAAENLLRSYPEGLAEMEETDE